MPNKILHFIHYFLAALSGVILDWIVWSVMMLILHHLNSDVAATVSEGISRSASACLGFYLSRNIVFSHIEKHRSQAGRYVIAVIGAWILSVIVVMLLSKIMHPWCAKFISDGTTFILNYAVMKYYVFKKTISSL